MRIESGKNYAIAVRGKWEVEQMTKTDVLGFIAGITGLWRLWGGILKGFARPRDLKIPSRFGTGRHFLGAFLHRHKGASDALSGTTCPPTQQRAVDKSFVRRIL